MEYAIPEELVLICREILKDNKTETEWGRVECDDMFQTERFVGGFDAEEQAFCFSFYEQGTEYWLQISLEQVRDIVDRSVTTIDIRTAES